MVDTEKVKDRVLKGAYTGAGAFVASFARERIQTQFQWGDTGTNAGVLLLGLATSVGADEFIDDVDSVPNDLVEYGGYGIQADAFSNMGHNLSADIGDSTAASADSDRVIEVGAKADGSPGNDDPQKGRERKAGLNVDTG